jgi:hypothetical protein
VASQSVLKKPVEKRGWAVTHVVKRYGMGAATKKQFLERRGGRCILERRKKRSGGQ